MGADTEDQLCAILRETPFSLQLDETTTSDNNALLMAYVRYSASNSQEMAEEFLGSRVLLLAFPTTYLVEQGFSQVLHMQSKYRNRLNLTASGALRLKLTSLQPAVKKLAENHQAQG